MRGLDPRIHLLLREKFLRRWMDCRVKPGNDSGVETFSTCAPLRTQPTSVRNHCRGNFIVVGLLFTMAAATHTCRAAEAPHVTHDVSPCLGCEAPMPTRRIHIRPSDPPPGPRPR